MSVTVETDKIEKQKQYYQENKIKIIERQLEYYEANRDTYIGNFKEYNKKYYLKNREQLLKKNITMKVCCLGCKKQVGLIRFNNHLKSVYHTKHTTI